MDMQKFKPLLTTSQNEYDGIVKKIATRLRCYVKPPFEEPMLNLLRRKYLNFSKSGLELQE